MREAVVYENHTYHCDVRSAESLDKIYETRKDWLNGLFHYDQVLKKSEIADLLKNNLVAVEGLEEINEEDWETKLED